MRQLIKKIETDFGTFVKLRFKRTVYHVKLRFFYVFVVVYQCTFSRKLQQMKSQLKQYNENNLNHAKLNM